MSFTKRTYVDRNTIITAENLNDIQDELIRLGSLNSVYIGAVQPTDGTLYWLDTSDSGGAAEEYSITVNLTNVAIDNAATSITEWSSYAAALTANEGYTLAAVTVTMGGANVTNTAYASGSIYIASVTGDIVVTAAATETPSATPVYAITNNLLHATSDNAAVSAEENTAYTATLTADEGYTLATVTVTMGGANVTAEVYADGIITIPAVTGNVVITVTTVAGLEIFAPEYLTLSTTSASVSTDNLSSFAEEMPDTICIAAKNVQEYWTSGGYAHMRTYTAKYAYTEFPIDNNSATLEAGGVKFAVRQFTREAFTEAYQEYLASIEEGLIGEGLTVLMGNVPGRFDSSFKLMAFKGPVTAEQLAAVVWEEVPE